MNALELRHVSVAGRLSDVSMTLPAGRLCGLVGPNGAGKSTLLQVAAGLLPTQGEVLWRNRKLVSIPSLERGRSCAWVPQEARFEFGFTVRSVVAQGRYAHGDDETGIDEALASLNMTKLAARAVNRLSGGEKQRVLLARALATAAPLQLWDEPLAPLDPKHVLDVLKLCREMTEKGATILFSLHDLRLAYCLDEVVVMKEGRIKAAGKPQTVLAPEVLLEVFGVAGRMGTGLVLELPKTVERSRNGQTGP